MNALPPASGDPGRSAGLPSAAPPGRRAAHKQATRQALLGAAAELFAERGYQKATVHDIAARAGVTARTFFRYFESKEALIADQSLGWLPLVQQAIIDRPGEERPLTAVRRALAGLMRANAGSALPDPRWLFTDGPPAPRMRRTGPALILKFEAALAQALRARLAAHPLPAADIDPGYLADVVARGAVAASRSALIRDWQLRSADATDRPPLDQLLDQAFDALGSQHGH